MKKVEHIGIAVKSIAKAEKIFTALFKTEHYKTETVESENVTTAFYRLGETKVELLEATDPASPIAKFIEKRGEGIHHLAFEVEDIFAEIKRLKAAGFVFIGEEPKSGADNKLICFLHPQSTNGVLVELCQEKK